MAYGRYMKHFSQKEKELWKRMGWAQEDLARQINVSLSTIQRWEGKGAKPTRLARKELARLLQKAGIDIDWDNELNKAQEKDAIWFNY